MDRNLYIVDRSLYEEDKKIEEIFMSTFLLNPLFCSVTLVSVQVLKKYFKKRRKNLIFVVGRGAGGSELRGHVPLKVEFF